MRRTFVALLAILVVACASPKPELAECGSPTGGISNPDYGFSVTNFSCQQSPIIPAFSLNSASFSSVGGLSAANVIADVNAVRNSWSGAGAHLNLGLMTTTSGVEVRSYDGAAAVYMAEADDAPTDGTDALARAGVWGDPSTGEAFECDVRVFHTSRGGSTIPWVDTGTAGTGQVQLVFVLAHEFGHCVGLADQTAFSTMSDVMFGTYTNGTNFTGLGADDIEAAIFLYGPA